MFGRLFSVIAPSPRVKVSSFPWCPPQNRRLRRIWVPRSGRNASLMGRLHGPSCGSMPYRVRRGRARDALSRAAALSLRYEAPDFASSIISRSVAMSRSSSRMARNRSFNSRFFASRRPHRASA